jgi:hypothetical protein
VFSSSCGSRALSSSEASSADMSLSSIFTPLLHTFPGVASFPYEQSLYIISCEIVKDLASVLAKIKNYTISMGAFYNSTQVEYICQTHVKNLKNISCRDRI